MHDQRRRAGGLHPVGEGEESGARLLLVDADAAFDRDRDLNRRRHRRHAFGDQHQARA